MRYRVVILLALLWIAPVPAAAQRANFQRTFEASTPVTINVVTVAGRIGVTPGPAGRVVVLGTVTVRSGVNVPANALELAARVAASPPIQQTGDRIELQLPYDNDERRAVTIAYEITVPPGTRVDAESDSGEVTISGNTGPLNVSTGSGAVTLAHISDEVVVTSGSGAVSIAEVGGTARVTTQSSAITLSQMGGGVHVQTQSGAVGMEVAPGVTVDVQTGSSAIAVSGDAGSLRARSNSGRVRVDGRPTGEWSVESGSGRIELTVSRMTSARLDLSARSGTITIPSRLSTSTLTKQHVIGALGAGEFSVTVSSGSGGVLLRLAN
jgi:hypothetical protein